jgi:beta-barrel assembly-enhancing protease
MQTAIAKSLSGLILACVAGVFSSCSAVSPIGTGNFYLAEDEKRIWNRSREEAKRLDDSGQLYPSQEIVEYVNEVARGLVPKELSQRSDFSFNVRILRNPLLNAFALSHGAVYVHTGMLAKLENEAQLATILAHELIHITHRHPVRHFRTIQNLTTTLAVLQIAGLPAGYYGNLATLLGGLGATAAVSGYSKGLESEADFAGLDLLVNAGYDPAEAPKLFEVIQKDLADRKIEEPFFFGSHPRLEERKENYAALLAKAYAGKPGITGDEGYSEIMYPLLLDNAQMDLSLGRWEWAEESIRRSIAIKPDDPKGYYCLGELFRRRAEDADWDKAGDSYSAAVERDNSFALPHRGLGLVWMKKGDTEKARSYFRQYLALAPQADDRLYIEQYLASFDSKGAVP